jgi:homoserine O-acetyltransferase/O-succinyltransferase
MKACALTLLVALVLLVGLPAYAQQDQVHVIREFAFENGQKLTDMKVGYVTHGKLNATRSNAVLVTHATNGLRTSFNVYIGPGKAFDTNRYFVIAVDAIGGGLSSSPKDGLGISFPRYTIRDMVKAQHDLVTRGLGLSSLLAVGGPSMGSFQALEWGIHYPDFVKGLLLIVPAAKSDPQFQMLADTMIATVQLDPAWQDGKYAKNPTEGLTRAAMIFMPWLFSQEHINTNARSAEEYRKTLTSFVPGYVSWDAASWMWRYYAARDHDVSKPFNGNLADALGRIRAKALLLPSVTDRLIPPAAAREIYRHVKTAEYYEIPSIRGHLAYFPAAGEKSPEYAYLTARVSEFLNALEQGDGRAR